MPIAFITQSWGDSICPRRLFMVNRDMALQGAVGSEAGQAGSLKSLEKIPLWAASREPDPPLAAQSWQTWLCSLGPSILMPAQLPFGPCLCPTSGETVNNSSFLSGACCLQGIYRLLLARWGIFSLLFKFSSLCLPPLTYLLRPPGFPLLPLFSQCLFHIFFHLQSRNNLAKEFLWSLM